MTQNTFVCLPFVKYGKGKKKRPQLWGWNQPVVAQTGLFNLNSFLFACLNNVQEELSPVWALALASAPTYVKILR